MTSSSGPPENIERLKRAFRVAYDGDPNVDEITAADVMTRLGEAAAFDTVAAEAKEVEGNRVRVATPRALYLLKDTVRPLDHQDAEALRRRFDL